MNRRNEQSKWTEQTSKTRMERTEWTKWTVTVANTTRWDTHTMKKEREMNTNGQTQHRMTQSMVHTINSIRPHEWMQVSHTLLFLTSHCIASIASSNTSHTLIHTFNHSITQTRRDEWMHMLRRGIHYKHGKCHSLQSTSTSKHTTQQNNCNQKHTTNEQNKTNLCPLTDLLFVSSTGNNIGLFLFEFSCECVSQFITSTQVLELLRLHINCTCV